MIVYEGLTIIFAGRRWRIVAVDDYSKRIDVMPSDEAAPPVFGGGVGDIHDGVAKEMLAVYRGEKDLPYLDGTANSMLSEAQSAFKTLEADASPILEVGDDCILLPWVGTRRLETLVIALRAHDLNAHRTGWVIEVPRTSPEDIRATLATLASSPPVGSDLAVVAKNLCREKFDPYVSAELLRRSLVVERLDVAAIPMMVKGLLSC